MKKTIWSLAALMLMAAPVMTSCSNDLDEVAPAEEVKSNVVTITIAPPAAEPESRVTMGGESGLNITGWELNDEVTLFYESLLFQLLNPVTFKCIDPSTSTFSGDLGDKTLADYNYATFGGIVKSGNYSNAYDTMEPKVMCSKNLKDVVMMVGAKDGEGNYAMTIINNALKIKNGTSSDLEVAWYGSSYMKGPDTYFTPMNHLYTDGISGTWKGAQVTLIKDSYKGWANAAHFTLEANEVSYVNMPMIASRMNNNDTWGLAKEDGTVVLTPKGHPANAAGKLYNAGTINPQ